MRHLRAMAVSLAALLASGGLLAAKAPDAKPAAAAAPEATTYKAMVGRYCVACHNNSAKMANLTLEGRDFDGIEADAAVWEKVARKLRGRMMPPPGMPRPDEATTDAFVNWLEGHLDHGPAASDPGRVVLHRLNRKEYANAVRDLLAVEVQPAAILPQDDTSDGFDNVADVLQVSPSFLDQYISAARSIAIEAVGDPKLKTTLVNLRPPAGLSQGAYIPGLPLGTRGGLIAEHVFPADGDYDLTFGGSGSGVYSDPLTEDRFLALVDGKVVFDSANGEPPAAEPATPVGLGRRGRRTKVRLHLTSGAHTIAAAYVAKTYQASLSQLSPLRPNAGLIGPAVTGVEIQGPFKPAGLGRSPSRDAIFICRPKAPAAEAGCARRILSSLARKAFRRPVTEADLAAPLRFYADGQKRGGFEQGVQEGIMAILASPKFLYRTTAVPAGLPPGAKFPISDIDLASRLSFFLWSSIPDDQLLSLAEKGRLKDPKVLEAQVKRMLADPRSESLVTNFAFQWLRLGELDVADPDPAVFPEFDNDLKVAMREEMRLFLDSVLREDRPVTELMTANYTFVNERLARHYGIPNIVGNRFRKVQLADTARYGLLGKAAILTVTSYANRTAPVLRGAWILENITGTPPTPPPPGVGALNENVAGQKALTVRQLMEVHRAEPSCNACHGIMDPLGLSLENFDAVGGWRKKDRFAGETIDASATMITGAKLNGVDDLRAVLAKRPEPFVQTFTEKLTTFALGRSVDYHDMPAIRALVRDAGAHDYRFSTLVTGIVRSDQFRMSKVPGEPSGEKVAAAPRKQAER